MSKIVQIENKEEEEAKEEIVTQTMMIQHFETDSRLEINRNDDHSWKIRNQNSEEITSIPMVRLAVPVLLFMEGNLQELE